MNANEKYAAELGLSKNEAPWIGRVRPDEETKTPYRTEPHFARLPPDCLPSLEAWDCGFAPDSGSSRVSVPLCCCLVCRLVVLVGAGWSFTVARPEAGVFWCV